MQQRSYIFTNETGLRSSDICCGICQDVLFLLISGKQKIIITIKKEKKKRIDRKLNKIKIILNKIKRSKAF